MSVERVGVERRAAIHAALGELARLRIVEALSLGDASPGELADLSGLPSNLLAHHLQVLEEQGLITRAPSEGDRRRSYVRLVPEPLEALHTVQAAPPKRVLFVCTANSARSHLAAALWRRASAVPAESAGTHPAERVHPLTRRTAARHRVPLRRVRPRHVSDVRAAGDLMVTVCDQAHEDLARSGDLLRGGFHWSVRDPVVVDTDEAFERAFADLSARVRRLAAALADRPRSTRKD